MIYYPENKKPYLLWVIVALLSTVVFTDCVGSREKTELRLRLDKLEHEVKELKEQVSSLKEEKHARSDKSR